MAQAAVLYGFGEPLRVETVTVKPPREGEIAVRVVASGVCHSDLSVVQAKLPFPPPVVLGHEGAGIVEEVGKGVTSVRPGDHVVLAWVQACGTCHYCIAGRGHLCEAGTQGMMAGEEHVFEHDGVSIARMAGVASFADHTVVRASAAIPIPKDVPLDRACLVGCGVMTGVGAAINTARIQVGETAAIIGCGGVGLNVIQGCALAGAGRIIAVDVVPQKLALARTFGATDVVNAREVDDAAIAVRELTGGLGVDYAFEVIGAEATIRQAFMSIKRGGSAIVVGVSPMGQDIALPGWMLSLEEKAVRGSLYGSANLRRDIPRLVELYRQKKLKLDELVSRTIPLADVNGAFEAMEKGEVARSVIRHE